MGCLLISLVFMALGVWAAWCIPRVCNSPKHSHFIYQMLLSRGFFVIPFQTTPVFLCRPVSNDKRGFTHNDHQQDTLPTGTYLPTSSGTNAGPGLAALAVVLASALLAPAPATITSAAKRSNRPADGTKPTRQRKITQPAQPVLVFGA